MGEWAALVICISVGSFAEPVRGARVEETGCRCAEEFFAIGSTVYICVFVSVFLPFPDVTSNCDLQHQHEPVLVQGSNPVEDASVSDQATLEGMFCGLLGLRVFWGFFWYFGFGVFCNELQTVCVFLQKKSKSQSFAKWDSLFLAAS